MAALDSAIKFGAGRYRQSQNLLEELGDEIARFGKKVFIVSGERAWSVVEEKLVPALREAHVVYQLHIWPGQCSFEAAAQLAAEAHQFGAQEIVGIGGGKIMDLSKAVGVTAGLGVVNIPTSASTCAPFTCMSVMYTRDGGKDTSWRFDHEIDACYLDMDVVANCPIRYNAAGILDAMAKKIEMLNGRPALDINTTPIDVYSAQAMASYTYEVLHEFGPQAIEDNRQHKVTKALNDVAFMNVPLTGVIANTTKSFAQSELAHVIYDGVRTHFTHEAAQAIHGEIVAVGLFCQLSFNGMPEEAERLREFMRGMDLPLTLGDLGIDPTEKNLETIEHYIVNSRHYNSDDPADLERLRVAIREMV